MSACRIKKMVVWTCVGVEINRGAINHDFPQKTGRRKLVQSIVNCRQGNARPVAAQGLMNLLGGHMLIPAVEQKCSQRHPLPCRAKPGILQKHT